MRWPTTSEQHAYLKMRQDQNLISSLDNPNELWMYEKLHATTYNWSRQRRWGYRIFDFWNHLLGIAVEVDGPEHNPHYDNIRDQYNLTKSGILVLRVRNRNEEDAQQCHERIFTAETWNERRSHLGLKPITT